MEKANGWLIDYLHQSRPSSDEAGLTDSLGCSLTRAVRVLHRSPFYFLQSSAKATIDWIYWLDSLKVRH